MRVVITAEARADLDRIGVYIAQDNPSRARTFVRELTAKARALGDLPEGFERVARYGDLNIRRRPYGNCLIFYRVDPDAVVIIHVLQGASDYEALLFGNE